MSTDLLERLPGTPAWVRKTFTPKVELRLRTHLRVLQRATDARAVVLWLPRHPEDDEVITYAGDRDALPARFEHLRSSVPSYSNVLIDDERAVSVLHSVRLGRGLPTLGLAVLAPGAHPSPELLEAVEDAGEQLEEVSVDALT